MAAENGADAMDGALSQASPCASVDDSTAEETSSIRKLRAWGGARVFPNSADQFDRMTSRRAQQETLYMAQQKDAIAKDVDEIHDQVYRADQHVRVYLPVGRAIVFESKHTICSMFLPLPVQSLLISRKTLVTRMVVFNAMLIAGAVLYCFGIHDPASWMAFGGLLLIPPALYGILLLNTTLLRFCLQQFSCNFMLCNVVILWSIFFMGYPHSAPVLVGYVGLFACGILYCYQEATIPAFRGRRTAVASGTGLILLILIIVLNQTDIAQLQNRYFTLDGFTHDLKIRISFLAFNLAIYQLRIVVYHWTNASHRFPSARCHMRSILLSPKDMIRLKTIVDALCKLETSTVDSSLTGGSTESVRVVYPVIKPYILLHADCVMSHFLSVRAYRFLYRRFFKPRILFATELCLGAGMALGVIAATQMRYRTLAIPGFILVATFSYPLMLMMNVRLMRSLLKSFEVLFVLFNLLLTFGWAIFGMHSWLSTLGWTCVLGGCILTLFSDTLPAKLVTSRTRVVIALESFLGLVLSTLLIIRGSSDTINDGFRFPMIPDVHPLQYVLGYMINSLIFAFKAVLLGFFSRGSPWILRPEMVTSRMPLKFFELFQELMHFEPEDKFENSRSSMNSRTDKSRTHRSVSVLALDELPTDIPEEEESSVNYS